MNKEVTFVDELPRGEPAFHFVDLGHSPHSAGDLVVPDCVRLELADYYPVDQDQWKHDFISWLGALNRSSASPEWWAHGVTAKNLLSSPFGNWILEVMAVRAIVETMGFERLYVVGATSAQAEVLAASSQSVASFTTAGRLEADPTNAEFLVRLGYQFLRVLFMCVALPWGFRRQGKPDICIFTYVNGSVKNDTDDFFGHLANLLRKQKPTLKVVYLAFLHSPFFSTLKALRTQTQEVYWPLFFELSFGDLVWAARKTSLAAHSVKKQTVPRFAGGLDIRALFQAAMWRDLVRGQYFFNLLVFRAARRYAARNRPSKLIYPFENKSLEKLLILGFRAGHPACRIDGYQHTSITPRHTTLLFSEGEAANTPMPDRVITAGAVAKAYLQERGNYPDGMLTVGCALRQHWGAAVPVGGRIDTPVRILLALSSSRLELVSALSFFRGVAHDQMAGIQLMVRPHPEFPLSQLPIALANWVEAQCIDATGTALAENLQWCDIVAYVSSTVALETLMRGKPVVNIDIKEALNTDPIIGEIRFHARVRDVQGIQNFVESLRTLDEETYRAMAEEALRYVQSYLIPATPDAVRVFLE